MPVWLENAALRPYSSSFLNSNQLNNHCSVRDSNNETSSVTLVLFGSGFIHNATSCTINTKEVRTLPELCRTDYTRLDTPAWFAPDPIPELVPEESPRKEDLPAAVRELDDINTCLASPLRSLDVDTLFHTRHTTLQQGHQTYWYLITTMISCVLVISLIIGYSLRFYIQRLFCDMPISKTPESNQAPQVSPRTHTPEYAVVDIKKDQPRENVAFASHSLHMSN